MRKYLSNIHAGVVTFYRFSIASLFFISYLIITSNVGISNIFQIVIGVVVGIGTILYYEGLKRLKAAQVSGIELSTPFFAALLAFFILSEKITFMQIVGIFLLFIGIYCLTKKDIEV
jgi:drug/metabolite transporter (DMT)-like permease